MRPINKTLLVSDIMTEHLFLLNKSDSIEKASSMFAHYNVRHFPVVASQKVIGILSKTDIERLYFDNFTMLNLIASESTFLNELKVEDVMKRNPDYVFANDSLVKTAKKLARQKFHAYPVLNHNKELVGIVTTTDVINHLIDQLNYK